MIHLSQRRIAIGFVLGVIGLISVVVLFRSRPSVNQVDSSVPSKAALVSKDSEEPYGFEAMYVPSYEAANSNKKQGWFGSNTGFGEVEMGETVMPELGNATIKAELGRAAWRVIHTVCARYPLKPSQDQQEALRKWIYLLSRLYPCGQCARHFQGLLVTNPPKVGTRQEASQWACDVHNIVNTKLNKPQFNCTTVLDHWQCGCAESDK